MRGVLTFVRYCITTNVNNLLLMRAGPLLSVIFLCLLKLVGF